MAERDRTPFGERLWKARTHAKLSQPQLAKAAGLSQSTIGELEWTGHGSQKTAQIAQVCGVRPEWLAKGEEPMLDANPVLRPEVREIAEAMGKLKPHQVEWAMVTIRGALSTAPYVQPKPDEETEQPENQQREQNSSSTRGIR